MYKATVVKIKNVRAHSNADLVKLATCHGNQVVVGLETAEDDLGIYFPTDGVLSHDFCYYNNLYRKPDMNSDIKANPGMFDDNRRVRTQKFRGEISDGFWMPISCFDFIYNDLGIKLPKFEEGIEIDDLVGIPICKKYMNKKTQDAANQNTSKKTKRAKTSIMFKEHFDTAQLGKNLHEINPDELIVITEKLHGTSGRIGNVLVSAKLNWLDKIAKAFGIKIHEKDWMYLNGTRRVVLEETSGNQFHDPNIRDIALKKLDGHIRKGETFYFEIVGYETNGSPIMGSVDTSKIGDKSFVAKYGKNMEYSYGCQPGTCEIYVYRITITNEDGHSIDLSWNDVVLRCNEIGVKHVPLLGIYTLDHIASLGDTLDVNEAQNEFLKIVEELVKGPSTIDPRHIREGVVVKIDNYGINPKVYKHKSFEFKVLEGIVKDSGAIDMEESS